MVKVMLYNAFALCGCLFQYAYGLGHYLTCKDLKIIGWNEPVATNTPVEDEVVQAGLGMNQKHIFPYPKFLIFSTSFLPYSFPSYLPPSYLCPTSYLTPTYLPPPTYLTSFYAHFIAKARE
jgi:hypothetical protein